MTNDEWDYTAGRDVTGVVLTSDEWKTRRRPQLNVTGVLSQTSLVTRRSPFGYITPRS